MPYMQMTLDGTPASNTAPHADTAPYQVHSETSKAAAEKIAPKVSRLEGYVLDALFDHSDGLTDGLTDEQIDFVCADVIYATTLRPRRIALTAPKYREGPKGHEWQYRTLIRPALVEDSGTTRLTRFKNKAVVWRLTSAGREVAEARQ